MLKVTVLCSGAAISRWCDSAFQGARVLFGHDFQVAKHYKSWLTEVGCKCQGPSSSHALSVAKLTPKVSFSLVVDAREIKLEWPCNMWPQDSQLREVGQWSLRNYLDGALGVTFKLLRGAGLSVREIDTLVSDAKKELSDTRRHLYIEV
jgi:hypothetical protein